LQIITRKIHKAIYRTIHAASQLYPLGDHVPPGDLVLRVFYSTCFYTAEPFL
jgi:hypothetical protein